jgi:hypothetical protein
MEIPDFTRGAWKKNAPLGIVDIDISKMDFSRVGGAGQQQSVGHSLEG